MLGKVWDSFFRYFQVKDYFNNQRYISTVKVTDRINSRIVRPLQFIGIRICDYIKDSVVIKCIKCIKCFMKQLVIIH